MLLAFIIFLGSISEGFAAKEDQLPELLRFPARPDVTTSSEAKQATMPILLCTCCPHYKNLTHNLWDNTLHFSELK